MKTAAQAAAPDLAGDAAKFDPFAAQEAEEAVKQGRKHGGRSRMVAPPTGDGGSRSRLVGLGPAASPARSGTDCRIWNISDSPIILIPKSYPDVAGALHGMVRKKLVRVIQPNSFIDVDSRKYDLNKTNYNIQIKMHFVAAEIPTDGGKVHLKQHHDATYPNGVKVATMEVVFLHYEIKAKKEMYLTCGERGKVMEVSY